MILLNPQSTGYYYSLLAVKSLNHILPHYEIIYRSKECWNYWVQV